MDSPAIKKYHKIKSELPTLTGAKLEKAWQDLEVLQDIIRQKHPGFRFDDEQPESPEVKALTTELAEATRRIHAADKWFSENGPEHPQWKEAGRRVDVVTKQLGLLTGRAYELGLYWDGEKLVPWADAMNPTAITPQKVAAHFKGEVREPWQGTQVQDLSDME